MSIISGEAGDFEYATINIPAALESVDEIVRFLIQELVRSGQLRNADAEKTIQKVLSRESLGLTGIGKGLAVPHAEADFVDATAIVIGRCARPVNCPGTCDGRPVNAVCLFIAPDDTDANFKALEAIAKLRANLSL